MRVESGCEAKTGHLVLRLGRPRRVWDLFNKVGDKGPPGGVRRPGTWDTEVSRENMKQQNSRPYILSPFPPPFWSLFRWCGVWGFWGRNLPPEPPASVFVVQQG
jgi:hypothetical protein